MNAKISMLARVTVARKRMRDAASAASSAAEATRLAAEAVEHHIEDDIEGLVRSASDRFRQAVDANVLLDFERDRDHARIVLSLAAETTEKRRAEAEQRRLELAAKARELRTSEVVLERTRAERAANEKREEQILADDLSGSRQWRSSK